MGSIMARSPLLLLGDTVRELRRARGWSQETLAEKSNLHLNFVGRLERGEIVSPELISILKLAMGLDVTPAELLARFTPEQMKRLRSALRREVRNPHEAFLSRGKRWIFASPKYR
jgi:XRE family transcriptional regulator, regulator of sulfur utilization